LNDYFILEKLKKNNFSMATEIDPRGEQNQSVLTTNKEPYDDEPI